MSDLVFNAPATSSSGEPVAGVAIAVLRDTLDLMEAQGAAVVTMINAAPVAGNVVSAARDSLSDPSLGHNVDVFV